MFEIPNFMDELWTMDDINGSGWNNILLIG
jgi:hypothetical protein